MSEFRKVLKYTRELDLNYVGVEYCGIWNGYRVYAPFYKSPCFVGYPHFLLVSKKEIKLITDTTLEILSSFPDFESDFEDYMSLDSFELNFAYVKNYPFYIEKGTYIKSFKLIRGGYGYPVQIYQYKHSKKNGTKISYKEDDFKFSCKKEILTVVIDESEKFNRKILSIIKYWRVEDFGTNEGVCDGEWFEFSATLSDGQKIKSQGYNYFPPMYYKFVKYLDKILKEKGESTKYWIECGGLGYPASEEVFEKWLNRYEEK